MFRSCIDFVLSVYINASNQEEEKMRNIKNVTYRLKLKNIKIILFAQIIN